MKITKQQLDQLIREALLTELFDSPPYPYSVKEMNVVTDAHAESVLGRVVQQDVLYEFKTDPAEGDYGGEGFSYVVSFTLDMLEIGSMPWELDPDLDPDNYFWAIVFEAKEIGNPNSDYDITQTNQGDMRVLSTISAIVENFTTEVLPEIPDHEVKTFSFIGSESHIFDDQKGHVITARGDKGQTRRTKIYLAMLKKKLPPGAQVIPIPKGGFHGAGSAENIIFFKIP